MDKNRLRASLLLLRISIFVVMLVWTLDKFIRPDHASGIFENLYYMSGLPIELMYVFGAIELILIIGFLLGVYKTWTYGFVLLAHGVTTLLTYNLYYAPFTGENILFFASWPMLAGCITLFLLRDEDKLATLG